MSTRTRTCPDVEPYSTPLPALRFEMPEAARILRMSRARLYTLVREGAIKPQKDGSRTYITRVELVRYVKSCDRDRSDASPCNPQPRHAREQVVRPHRGSRSPGPERHA